MDPKKHIEGERFVLSKVKHNLGHSVMFSLFTRRPITLFLYSDGSLERGGFVPLNDDDTIQVLNVSDLEKVRYQNADYQYHLIYRGLNILSMLSGLILLCALPWIGQIMFVDFVRFSSDDLLFWLAAGWSPFIICGFD